MDPQINIFSNAVTATRPPFLFNNTYDISQSNEASAYNSIAGEFQFLYGSDVVYLPREVNLEEMVFGEYLSAVYDKGIQMRMFIEETEAWSGNGDMYSKFGLQVTDECTLQANKSAWEQATNKLYYPKPGDLIYIPKSQKLFQISHIEDECSPGFYLFGNRTNYKIQCKLFIFNSETFTQTQESGIPAAIQALDNLLADINGNQVTLDVKDFNANNQPLQDASSTVIIGNEVDAVTGL